MAHGKVITAMVRLGREAVGNLRKTGVYHDGRDVSLGQGRLFGAARAGTVRSVRSVKRDNAENQRARIAPGLGRHWIGWPGCRDWLAELIASGSMDRSEMPKGRSLMAGRGSAMRQRSCFGGRCVFAVHRKPEMFVWGSGDWGKSGLVLPGSVHHRLVLSAFVWPTRSVAFGDAGGCGVAGLAW